jgi:hypothetical protein
MGEDTEPEREREPEPEAEPETAFADTDVELTDIVRHVVLHIRVPCLWAGQFT